MKHLAIFIEDYIEKILRGEKTMDSRFSIKKELPYGMIKKGDEIYLKHSGGLIEGRVEVDNVLFYDNLTPEVIGKLRKEYQKELCASDEFWQRYGKSKCVTLIFLKNPERFISPVKFKKKDRRPWLILDREIR